MTRVRILATVGALWGCGESSITVELQMPPAAVADEFESACVNAVTVFVDGANFPTDSLDWAVDCYDLPADADRSSYRKLRAAVSGHFEIDLPESGLSAIEVYGHTGACSVVHQEDYDLIFHGAASYAGGGSLAIPVLPNLSCATTDMAVRPINILKLSATHDCARAAVTTGKIGSTTLSPLLVTDFLYWWGGLSSGDLVGGVASFRGRSKVGSSVLGLLHTVDGTWASLATKPPATQQVCATGAEIEAATIPLAVARSSQDAVKIAETDAVAFGLVYGATGPISGATVTVAGGQRDLAQIVYLDLPVGVENGTGALVPRADASTGPSGLFAVYTAAMLDLTITANGRSVQRKLATATNLDRPAPPVAMIVKL